VFVSFKKITCWVLEKGTIIAIKVFMAARYTIAAWKDSKAKEEEVCISGWEEGICCEWVLWQQESRVHKREENRVLMCLKLCYQVENNRRFNQVVS